MNPYYFGSSDHRLFGCYYPAVGGGARGIVLCNPLGREYFAAHKTVGFLARRLAEAGVHVLKFDYYGTGDSDGSQLDAGVETHVTDVRVALEELQEVSCAMSVSLLGIRAGADVAMRVSRTNGSIARLVLWDPLIHPREPEVDEPSFGEPPGSLHKSHPVLIVSTHPEPRAYRSFIDAVARGCDAPSVIHAPAAPFWLDDGPGSVGLPVTAVAKAVKWLSN